MPRSITNVFICLHRLELGGTYVELVGGAYARATDVRTGAVEQVEVVWDLVRAKALRSTGEDRVSPPVGFQQVSELEEEE